jgi:integrase
MGSHTARVRPHEALGGHLTEDRTLPAEPAEDREEVTINRELAVVRNVYSMAVKWWGQADQNPVKDVKLAREDNGRTRHLSDDEERRLLAECKSHLYPLVLTGIHTALRRSELLSLKWGNVNLEHRLVTVEAGYSKNGEARSVPMSLRLTETLEAIKISDPNAAVFLNSDRKPYRNVTTAFNSAVKRAGIQDFTFHDLRHTFASRLVMAGVDLTTVKELMGHKTISMTLRYSHLSPEHRRAAVAIFDVVTPDSTSCSNLENAHPSK